MIIQPRLETRRTKVQNDCYLPPDASVLNDRMRTPTGSRVPICLMYSSMTLGVHIVSLLQVYVWPETTWIFITYEETLNKRSVTYYHHRP